MVTHIARVCRSTGEGCQSCSWSAEQGKLFFPCLRSLLKIWSRETGLAVPSRVTLLISILRLNLVLTHGIPPDFRGGVHIFINDRHTPSGQSRVYRVTQLRTDGVHCRESADTGPVNLKIVPNALLPWQVTMDQLICAFLSHTHDRLLLLHTHYRYEMSMSKVLDAFILLKNFVQQYLHSCLLLLYNTLGLNRSL